MVISWALQIIECDGYAYGVSKACSVISGKYISRAFTWSSMYYRAVVHSQATQYRFHYRRQNTETF